MIKVDAGLFLGCQTCSNVFPVKKLSLLRLRGLQGRWCWEGARKRP